MVPPESPTKSPVLNAAPLGTNVLGPFTLVHVIVLLVTTASPEKVDDPVTLVAIAGVIKPTVLKATKLKRELFNRILCYFPPPKQTLLHTQSSQVGRSYAIAVSRVKYCFGTAV